MNTRRIGSLTVSSIGLGCNNFGWKIDEGDARKVVDAALDSGISFFDTADMYGATASEEFLAKALGTRRSRVVIATKFGMEVDERWTGGGHPDYVRAAVEGSLRRLRTDVIDLYYLHRPDPHTPIADTLGALEEIKQEGKVREYACSNFSADQLREAREAAQGTGFVAVQNEYSLLHREPEQNGVLQACQQMKLALIPYFPLKSGLLTGKYRHGQQPPEGSRLGASAGMFAGMGSRHLTDHNLNLVEKLHQFAASRQHTLLELAFSWLLCKPAVASVIAGATTPEQVSANAAAGSWKLDAEELAAVDALGSAAVRTSPG